MSKSTTGRPPKYSTALADTICSRLADGESLRSICRDKDMPSKTAVFNWMRTQEGFVDQYARAKEESADALVDDIVDIADGLNSDGDVQRDRLRVDARKWAASKLKPKKYSDKLDLSTGGGPLQINLVQFDDSNPAE